MKRYILLVILVLIAGVICAQHMYGNNPEEETLLTEDRHHIAYNHYKNGHKKVIIAHGFYNNKDTYHFQEISKMFSDEYDVICFDFRGHGNSDGLFTWTVYEEKDLRAVIAYAKKEGYEKIGVIGFSLGAAISLIESSHNADVDSVLAVSGPYDFWKIDYKVWEPEMMEDLQLNILSDKGKGKSIRPGNPFMHKTRPIDIVANISPRPVMFMHGDNDWLIASEHSEKLFEAAKEPKVLKIFSGAGHAEKIYDDSPEEFETACLEWFDETL